MPGYYWNKVRENISAKNLVRKANKKTDKLSGVTRARTDKAGKGTN